MAVRTERAVAAYHVGAVVEVRPRGAWPLACPLSPPPPHAGARPALCHRVPRRPRARDAGQGGRVAGVCEHSIITGCETHAGGVPLPHGRRTGGPGDDICGASCRLRDKHATRGTTHTAITCFRRHCLHRRHPRLTHDPLSSVAGAGSGDASPRPRAHAPHEGVRARGRAPPRCAHAVATHTRTHAHTCPAPLPGPAPMTSPLTIPDATVLAWVYPPVPP